MLIMMGLMLAAASILMIIFYGPHRARKLTQHRNPEGQIIRLPSILCSLLNRRNWRFVARKETGPSFLNRQHHVSIYERKTCHVRREIVGRPLRKGDASLPLDVRPPVRSMAMRLRQLL